MIESLGHFKILELIGSGPLGDVCRARDARAGRTVAITVVPDRIALDPDNRERFLRDMRAAASVSHPNILTLYDISADEGDLYLVHEFVQGQTLRMIIAGHPLNPRRAIDLATEIAEGLATAHAADLVHGAITPDAIVVTAKGHAKITGFGLSQWVEGAAASAFHPTVDLAGVGAVLFEMLTGRPPAAGAAVPSALNRSLPREIDPIVAKALGKSGGYEAAATLAAELRAIGAVLDARKDASIAAGGRPAVRPPARSYARGVVFALIAAAAAAAAWWYFRSF
jgi:serine/threonine-protein kinase